MKSDQMTDIINRHQANAAVVAPSEDEWLQSQTDILALIQDIANFTLEFHERQELNRLKAKYDVPT